MQIASPDWDNDVTGAIKDLAMPTATVCCYGCCTGFGSTMSVRSGVNFVENVHDTDWSVVGDSDDHYFESTLYSRVVMLRRMVLPSSANILLQVA